ncbi:membrane protein [Spirochaetia bacterium]|nr:membrane protein [Spirochaetia bacterium]
MENETSATGENPYQPPEYPASSIVSDEKYGIIQPNSVLRAYTREQLHGVWKKMAFAFFVIFLVYIPFYAGMVLNQIYPDVTAFTVIFWALYIVAMIIGGPFYLGFAGYFLKRIRGEAISTKNIFDGFKQFGRSFVLMLLTGIFTVLWMLLLFVPGIIKSFSYSMAFFILHDNPEMKPNQALKESCRMMKGYKWKLFCLEFSFIGWALLGILTLGIGYFWLYPYMYMSIANFYENLKTSQKN